LHKDELILRAGRVNKRRGLFSKKRYLILTDRPRLFYCADGAKSSSVPKGEIFWTPKMVPELKGKKQFWIHTVRLRCIGHLKGYQRERNI
jgi:3-phosphoinositide dependent protein kinase-1